jgi:CRP-like cAMP-binding protein
VDGGREREYSGEAVDDVIVMRYQRKATERLIDQNPALARHLRDAMLRDLANAHARTLLLSRMTATERVATFLLEMFDRRDRRRSLELPMPRTDIADYLGLTIETVCRILSLFKRGRIIAIPNPHRIELLDPHALQNLGETRC